MAKRGNTSGLANTCPIFSLLSWFVMTAPPFISLPVPAIVRMQPTGTMRHSGSSMRR